MNEKLKIMFDGERRSKSFFLYLKLKSNKTNDFSVRFIARKHHFFVALLAFIAKKKNKNFEE